MGDGQSRNYSRQVFFTATSVDWVESSQDLHWPQSPNTPNLQVVVRIIAAKWASS